MRWCFYRHTNGFGRRHSAMHYSGHTCDRLRTIWTRERTIRGSFVIIPWTMNPFRWVKLLLGCPDWLTWHLKLFDILQPANTGKCIRIFLTVILVCQTYLEPQKKESGKVTRDDLTCRITYCSVVNPGGWAPAGALRAIYKREYPKFLKRFTKYVNDQCQNKPIMF